MDSFGGLLWRIPLEDSHGRGLQLVLCFAEKGLGLSALMLNDHCPSLKDNPACSNS